MTAAANLEPWRAAVIAEAVAWLRTPWHHLARVKAAGVDCGQLIAAAFIGPGLVADFDTGQYTADWMQHHDEERYLAFVERYLDRIEGPPRPADVAVWRFGKCFSHGAVVVDWPLVIHAYRPEGMVTYGDATKGALAREHMKTGGSQPRPVRFYSIAGRLA